MKTLLLPVLLGLVFAACSTTIKTTDEAKARLQKHKTIAILPFEVRFDLRNKNQKQFTEKELAEVRHFMATGLQEHLYHWLISYSRKKPLSVDIQNIEITDSILSEKQIRFMDLYNMSRVELAKMLSVDAVLTPNVIFAQPNSEGASVAYMMSGIVAFNPAAFSGLATQEMRMQVLLNDNFSETALWTFKTKSQSNGVTKPSKDRKKENILYPLFRNIDESLIKFIKKFPYRKN
jgi:sulfur transfer protein SufE